MQHLLESILGFVICLGFSQIGIRLAPTIGLLDIPGGRRRHARPVALVGGLALIMSLLVRTIVRGRTNSITHMEGMAVLSMALLGLLDDRFDLRARWKAIIGLGLAILLAHSTAMELAQWTQPLSFLWGSIAPTCWVVSPLLVLMYWGLPQSFNLIDGANGLAIGFALVVLATLWITGFPHAFFVGAMVACLVCNWPQARLFLGDCGSLSIGLLLILILDTPVIQMGANHILWLFAYPAVDVSMVVLIRICQGRNPACGDRSHLHFQIRDRWPKLDFWAVPILLALAATCASELYLTGVWMIIPCAGLVILVVGAFSIGLQSIRAGGMAGSNERESSTPEDEESIQPTWNESVRHFPR